jgi:hypothetical protein
MSYLLWLGIVALGVIGVKAITDQIQDRGIRTMIFYGFLIVVGFLAFVLKF